VVELRVLTADDWHVWRDLRLAALAEAPQAFGSRLADWQGDGDREDRWRARLEIPGSINFVAVLDGQPAGMASGVPVSDSAGDSDAGEGDAELISMWVSPAARGHGVGDLLVRAVDGWARQAGAGQLHLAVTPDNDHAATLYLRNGFRFTGADGDLMADGIRREQLMVKPLAAGRDVTCPA
jgi:GNAT superfamily N-acetyltransferase